MKMWTKEIIGTEKPIIAMCHLLPLPGDPGYDRAGGMKKIIDAARRDLDALQEGGIDAVMFSNEFSMPYLTRVRTETVASMARLIGELLSEIEVPFGVNVLWDPLLRWTWLWLPAPGLSGRSSQAPTPAISASGIQTAAQLSGTSMLSVLKG
jgi:hypothetical protein